MYLFRADQRRQAEERTVALASLSPDIHLEEGADAPWLKPGLYAGAIRDPSCQDMDVHALHQGFLKGLKQAGGAIICSDHPTALDWSGTHWQVCFERRGPLCADKLINATGAWGDAVAQMAGLACIGLEPKRRTIGIFQADQALPGDMPLTLDLAESFYFRPEGGRILTSPADETPWPACDVQPDELDVATAAARVEAASGLALKKLPNSWAGLRTFAPDRLPVIGPDPRNEAFIWSVGQGGWGIQTAPAWGKALCDDQCGSAPAVDLGRYRPSRFRF